MNETGQSVPTHMSGISSSLSALEAVADQLGGHVTGLKKQLDILGDKIGPVLSQGSPPNISPDPKELLKENITCGLSGDIMAKVGRFNELVSEIMSIECELKRLTERCQL